MRRLPLPLLFLILALAAAALRGLAATCAAPDPYDQGFVLTEAMRLARGELPYRDYFATYGPLEPLLLVPFVEAVGPELILVRLLRSLAWGCTLALVAAHAWLLGGRAAAIVAVAVVAVLGGVVWPHPALAALLAVPLCLAWAWRASPARRPLLLGLAGSLAGVTGLLRWDFGGLAVVAGVAAVAWRERRDVPWFLLGGLPALLGYAALIGVAGWEPTKQVWDQIQAHAPYRSLPWIPADATGAAAAFAALRPLVLIAAAAKGLSLLWRERGAPGPNAPLLLCLFVLLAGLLVYANFRSDEEHLLPVGAVAAVFLGVWLAEVRGEDRPVAPLLFALGAVFLFQAADAVRSRARLEPATVPGLRGLRIDPDLNAQYRNLLADLDHRLPREAPLYCGTTHARHLINDALLYALANRPVATRYHAFNPGITTTPEVQAEILRELELRDVRVVVLARRTWWEEPNRSREEGATLLDAAIARRFKPVLELERWTVLERRY